MSIMNSHSFDENFWTHDYISGVNSLFAGLKARIAENQKIVAFIGSRVKSEKEIHSILSSASHAQLQSTGNIAQLLKQCTQQTLKEGDLHLKTSKQLEKLCLEPMAKTLQTYTRNLGETEQLVRQKYKQYQTLSNQSQKYRQAYYDLPKAVPVNGTVESRTIEGAMSTLRLFTDKYATTPDIQRLLETGKITLAGIKYAKEEFIELLYSLQNSVAIISYKVALLGTYANVSSGANIASSCRRLLQNDSIAYSEKFGQGLVDAGILKPIAQISNKFHNSHQSFYQWQPVVAQLLKGHMPESEEEHQPKPVAAPTLAPPIEVERPRSPGLVEESVTYLQSIIELDIERCSLEREIARVYEFLEKWELERVSVVQQTLTRFQEVLGAQLELEMTPEQDLTLFVREFRSGPFVPNVAVYESPNGAVCQSFGVDVKKTQFITPTFLGQLTDPLPIEVWTCKYKLDDVYKLRLQVNTGRKFNDSIFRFFKPQIIAATLKQYFLELPDSLVPFTMYDAVRQAYLNGEGAGALISLIPQHHYTVLEQFLRFLRTNYPTVSEQEQLGAALAPFLFRPRAVSVLTMDDTHPQQFITDLLVNFETLFAHSEDFSGVKIPRARPVSLKPLSASPSTGSQLAVENNRERAHSTSSNFETTNGTGLIPLSLSPNVNSAHSSPRTETRPSSRLSSMLPIGDGAPLPTKNTKGLGILSSPIRLTMPPSSNTANSPRDTTQTRPATDSPTTSSSVDDNLSGSPRPPV